MSRIDHIDQIETAPIDTICLTIVAPEHGGITVYESVDGDDPRPKFSGNLSEAVKYLELRMGKILRQPAKEGQMTNQGQVRSFSDIKREATGRLADLTDAG